MESQSMKTDQMELGLAVGAGHAALVKRNRFARSHWWFEQMRKAVDKADSGRDDKAESHESEFHGNRRTVLMAAEAA